jgi:hypothetical protein
MLGSSSRLTERKLVRTYVATSKGDHKAKKAIVIISDVFGVHQNSMLLADDFAASGFLTVVPDLFDGENLPLDVFQTNSVDIPAWVSRHSPVQIDPIIEKIIKHVREHFKVDKVGGAGYCFGGKVRDHDPDTAQLLVRGSQSGLTLFLAEVHGSFPQGREPGCRLHRSPILYYL